MSVLETESLTRRFGTLTAVDHITISVDAGEVFGLLGPNGAGKTTAIKMLTTLLPPTSGTASVCGFDVVRQAMDVRRNIAYVPQMLSADGALTGYENLLVFARLYDIPRRIRGSRVRDVLAFMGLTDAADKLVRTYSGGMIRRLEIGQAMLHRPRMLFLDEPTVGLDPLARRAVWDHIERMRADYGTSILLTTHYMEEAESLCDRIAIMHHGQVVIIGTLPELKASVPGKNVTLDRVFTRHTGDAIGLGGETRGAYRETSRTRRTVRRLG